MSYFSDYFSDMGKVLKKFVPIDKKAKLKGFGGNEFKDLSQRAGRNKLTDTITNDTTIDTTSKNEFLAMLTGGTKVASVGAEYNKAVEGIDPKYRSRKNVEEYYKAMIDMPGKKQTRSPDLLLSNAFNGVVGR